MPGRERHSLHLHAATKAGVDEILRPCLSASASQKRQFTVVRLLGRSRSEGARELTSDLVHKAGTRRHSRRSSASWTPCVTRRRGEGEEASYRNPELCDRYKRLPLASIQHGDLTQLPGFREAMVVVVGGETEGVSWPHTSAATAARDLNCSFC